MPIFSNVDQVFAWVQRTVEEVNFRMPGIHESLGYDMAIAVAEGIQERSYRYQRGATESWDDNVSHSPNADAERARKKTLYGSDKINYRTFQMLSMGSLTADVTIQDGGETVVMCYGTGEPPSSSLTGYLEEEDLETTDKEKAFIAHKTGRNFFELDQDIVSERVMPIVAEALTKYLQERANH
jgi:hypothetical protein